jgi:hypothetical protein
MQIDVQDYLKMVEDTGSLAFVDIESTGFRGDYNSVLVVSVLPFGGTPTSFSVKQPGNDQKVVKDAKAFIEQFKCVCTFYGKGFDWPMLNTRLLKWASPPIATMHHIDLYYTLKPKLNTSRKGLGPLAAWLDLPEPKISVSQDVWARIIGDVEAEMPTMIDRCEGDCRTTRDLYLRTKHLIRDIKKG